MKTRIDIDTKTFVRFILVVIGFGLAIFAIYHALTALLILGISLFLAVALNGPVNRISRILPGKSRAAATTIAYILVVIVLGAIIFLVVPPIVQQTAKFVQNVPSFVDSATSQYKGLNDLIAQYNLRPQVDQALNSIKDSTASWASNVGTTVITGVGSVFAFLTGSLLVLVLTFLMLIEGPQWMQRIWGLYDDHRKMRIHKRIVSRVYGVVNGYVTGQLTVSAIGGVLAGAAVFVLSFIFPQIPSGLAFPTAAITFTLSLIPMFGATIAGLLVTALLAFNAPFAAIIYIVYFFIYQQIENNFVAPQVQAKKIELSALAVLAAVTIGLYLFGLLGGIIAIPIAGTIRVLLDEYLKSRRDDDADQDEFEEEVVTVKKVKA
ncbi:MAG TPA: AI-2E family transporter [Candidatus Microsaccharimonas sp.]|jgi:predicted PurR-regulated permease PerM